MEYIELGQIVNTHGLKGSVKANIFSEDMENIKKYNKIYLKEQSKKTDKKDKINNTENTDINKTSDDKYIEYKVLDIKFTNNQAIISFKEITNKDEADRYKNRYIYILREDLEELDDDTFYLIDLIGLDVYELNNQNEVLGELIEVNQNAPIDIYVIKTRENKNILLPAIKEYIKEINIEKRKIVVDLSNYEI